MNRIANYVWIQNLSEIRIIYMATEHIRSAGGGISNDMHMAEIMLSTKSAFESMLNSTSSYNRSMGGGISEIFFNGYMFS